jgi:hypothetical protein
MCNPTTATTQNGACAPLFNWFVLCKTLMANNLLVAIAYYSSKRWFDQN